MRPQKKQETDAIITLGDLMNTIYIIVDISSTRTDDCTSESCDDI